MTLAQQIREIGERVVNKLWMDTIGVPGATDRLAAIAFFENWDRTSLESRAILHAMACFRTRGDIAGEMAVK